MRQDSTKVTVATLRPAAVGRACEYSVAKRWSGCCVSWRRAPLAMGPPTVPSS